MFAKVINPEHLRNLRAQKQSQLIGTTIHSKKVSLMHSLGYEFEEVVNGGAQGLIVKYRQIQTGRIVIVKFFLHRITFNIESEIYRRIQNEYPQLQRFVVNVLDMQPYPPGASLEDIVGEAELIITRRIMNINNGGGVIIMEWLSGGDLSEPEQFIRILKNPDWYKQWRVFLEDVKKVCLSIHFHHNDLKLRNIFFEINSPNEITFKLGDFGHSKFPSPNIEYAELERFDSWIEHEWDEIVEITKWRLSLIE